jgi:hypothetical protein
MCWNVAQGNVFIQNTVREVRSCVTHMSHMTNQCVLCKIWLILSP